MSLHNVSAEWGDHPSVPGLAGCRNVLPSLECYRCMVEGPAPFGNTRVGGAGVLPLAGHRVAPVLGHEALTGKRATS